MGEKFRTVRLRAGFLDEVQQEADVVHRSLGGQLEYWAELGKAVERTSSTLPGRIADVLKGTLRLECISARSRDPEGTHLFNALSC